MNREILRRLMNRAAGNVSYTYRIRTIPSKASELLGPWFGVSLILDHEWRPAIVTTFDHVRNVQHEP